MDPGFSERENSFQKKNNDKKNLQPVKQELSARDWIRTSTTFRMLPPEDSASTNFATRAGRQM